jgi:hypothetical protein
VGSLLGDADVWDDTPARPRPLRRGLAGLAAGLIVGLAVGWAVAPRPIPSAPVVPLPAARPPPQADQGTAVVDQAILAGPMLATGLGKLQEVQPNGVSARIISQGFAPVGVLPGRAGSPLVALGGDAVVLIDRAGTVSQLTPSGFRARGMAWAGSKLLACGRRPRPPVGGWRSGPALVLVDLATKHWELVPSEAPSSGPARRPPNAAAPTAGPVVWAPNGAFAHALPPDSWDPSGANLLVTYAPPVGTPTLLEVSHRTDSRMVFSPDGAWLLLYGGGQWVFIRVDDPSLRVSYVAPGQFAGWLPGQGTR